MRATPAKQRGEKEPHEQQRYQLKKYTKEHIAPCPNALCFDEGIKKEKHSHPGVPEYISKRASTSYNTITMRTTYANNAIRKTHP